MRFSAAALTCAFLATSSAFLAPRGSIPSAKLLRVHSSRAPTFLNSLAEPYSASNSPAAVRSGRNKDEIADELASGIVLEGGQVIDFSAVKGESRAEAALTSAREAIESGNVLRPTASQNSILGINSDVITEVGHDLGTFADPQVVQECAAYLRSKAPSGFFVDNEKFPSPNSESWEDKALDKARCDAIIRMAYEESGEVTSAYAKTFYMGTQLLPQKAREAIWAVYVWCRRTDEIVDAPREDDQEMLHDLSTWEMRLEALWNEGKVEDVFDLCLLDVRISYPNLPITPFVDMIRGMLMDVPDLGQDRYDAFDELHLYCYRVAGTVGLMSMPIFGCAPGFTEDEAREPALSLGVAFQLTNILRDVGEDAVSRGRIYLPREDMAKFGVTEEQIFARQVDDNFVKLMKYQIERARKYYDRARRGVFMLSEVSRLPVQSSIDAYGKILDKIEENSYDSLNFRAYVSKTEKLATIPFSWYRTLDVSKTFPIPGDRPFLDQA